MSPCDYCQGNPTAGPRGERCPICGALFGDMPPAGAAAKYQGWANRPTWCVALWVNNERETQSLAEGCADEDELRALVEEWADGYAEQAPSGHPFGMFADLVTGALSAVDWGELFAHWHPPSEDGAP